MNNGVVGKNAERHLAAVLDLFQLDDDLQTSSTVRRLHILKKESQLSKRLAHFWLFSSWVARPPRGVLLWGRTIAGEIFAGPSDEDQRQRTPERENVRPRKFSLARVRGRLNGLAQKIGPISDWFWPWIRIPRGILHIHGSHRLKLMKPLLLG